MPRRSWIDPPPSEMTAEAVYRSRRRFIIGLAAAGVVPLASANPATPLAGVRKNTRFSTPEAVNSFENITTYNNFYEFGTDKGDPSARAGKFRPGPGR